MPVPAEIRCLGRDHNDMADTRRDRRFTPRARVCLARLIWLDRLHELLDAFEGMPERPMDVLHGGEVRTIDPEDRSPPLLGGTLAPWPTS